ncbi:MAG: hypothetical protein AAFQ74_01915 [Cyanobacteria bacterium J06623_4]
MDKSILCLAVLGVALAILHVPSVMLTLAIIFGLLSLSIKLFWSMLQSFSASQSADPSEPSTRNA